jgi:tripartite-type tricarboxylate transporter receptor subunit TctC
MKALDRLVSQYSIAAFGAAFVGSIHCTIASAQGAGVASYPTRPIRLIVPFPPGGSNDILGRMLAQRLTQRLGQQVVVDNRAGGNAIIGTDIVAKAVPNGYTLLITSTAFTTSAAIQKLPYDPRKSFTSISLLGSGPAVLAVTPALPVRSTKELIAMAKGKAGQLRFASSGTGGINHFAGELFKNMAGVDLVHVPYKGGGPAMIDVMAGHLELMFGTLTQSSPHMRSGKLRAIAMTSKERWPSLPDIPTIAETLPGYESVAWWAIFAPAGLPAPIVTTLNAEIRAILVEPEVAKWFTIQGAEPRVDSPEALASHVAEELDKWSRVAKTNAIKVD